MLMMKMKMTVMMVKMMTVAMVTWEMKERQIGRPAPPQWASCNELHSHYHPADDDDGEYDEDDDDVGDNDGKLCFQISFGSSNMREKL